MQEMKTPGSGGGERQEGKALGVLVQLRAGNLLTPHSRKQHSQAAVASSLS